MGKMIKISQVIQRIQHVAADIKDLPRDKLLENFSNEIKKRQLKWTAKGSPITEDELRADLTADWKRTGFVYRRAGISLEELIEIGKAVLLDTSGTYELPRMVRRIVEKTGRNHPCPCGSGKKYKKCCGQ